MYLMDGLNGRITTAFSLFRTVFRADEGRDRFAFPIAQGNESRLAVKPEETDPCFST
jgi:hypothetical protein